MASIIASSLEASLPENRSGINSDPKAALPKPRLTRDKNFLLFRWSPCSNSSFSITFWLWFLLNYTKPLPHASWRLFGVFSFHPSGIHPQKALLPHPQGGNRTSATPLHSTRRVLTVPVFQDSGRQSF